MNHTFRLIWSHRSHCFVAVGEHARRCGKSARGAALVTAAALAAAIFPASPVSAGPTGGAIINGLAGDSITRPNAATTVINQASQRLAIDWTSFSSALGESIQFNQPNSSAIALNRVTGRTPSELLGNLTATGQVFVINPNGVLFGQNASVNVGGLLASTLDMKSNSFLDGRQELESGGMGAVVNKGALTASTGGYIVLAGPRVSNEGAIGAVRGNVLMAAGDKVTLTLNGTSLASYTIDRGSLNALVQNSGRISASEGEVTLTASAANDIGRAVINHTGIIEAQNLQGAPGKIKLVGTGETDLLVNGQLSVSGSPSTRGSVVTDAARVNIGEKALINGTTPDQVTDGTWTNKSRDFLIAEGNGPSTSSSIGAATLAKELATGAKTYSTPNLGTGTGDLYVNAGVEWNEASRLTLKSSQSIYINADIKATKGSLELWHGQSEAGKKGHDYFLNNGAKVSLPKGRNFVLSQAKNVAANEYYVITELGNEGSATGQDLQGLSNQVVLYVLGADIDAMSTRGWNNGAGFMPIGQFYGTLDGLGHKISNLFINNRGSGSVGMFDILAATKIGNTTLTGSVKNLTLENAYVSKTGVSTGTGIGALAGTNNGEIFNVHATMSVMSSSNNAGGLVGINNGLIKNSSAIGIVASEQVKDAEATGGLVGRQIGGAITDSYAMADVTGNRSVGGLVGLIEASGTQVTGSYAGVSADGKGSAKGSKNTGGLVGYLKLGGIDDSYAAIPVTGGDATGGLVGLLEGAVQRTYATGPVKSNSANQATVGGLVGDGSGTAFSSVWNTETTGQASSRGGAGAKGIGTTEMTNLSTFQGWNIDAEGGTGKTWRIYDGKTAPLLRSFLVTKNVEDKSVTYNNETQLGCASTPCGEAAGNSTFTPASGKNAGTYTPYDLQQGYDIRGGKLTIAPVLLTASAISPARIYDGTTDVPQQELSIEGVIDGAKITANYASAQYDDKRVGDRKAVTFSGIKLSGTNAGNYETAGDLTVGNARITKRELTLTGTEVGDKEYDGTTVAARKSLGRLLNNVANDDVRVADAASVEFSTKNAGDNKLVTLKGVSLTGDDAANYSIADAITVETTASIFKRAVSLTGTEVGGRVYDGSTKVEKVISLGELKGKVKGDTVMANAAAVEFVDKKAGGNKEVKLDGVTLTGDDAANYTIADTARVETNAIITKRALTLSQTEIADKVYDGSTAATLTNAGTLKNVVANDEVKTTLTGVTAAFADKNAGQGKTVTVSNLGLAGADADNYVLDSTQTATATILPRPLTVRAQGVDKVYDGNANAAVTLGDNRIEGDRLDLRYARASFADSNAGSGKTVTVSGIAASGADAGNYVADATAVTTASVDKAPLVITANPDSKAFDGKAYRGGNGVSYAGFVAGENAAVLGGQPSYGGDAQGAVNVGTYRIAPGGHASQNYAIVYVDGKLTIQQPPVEPVYQAAGAEVAAVAAAVSGAASKPDSMRLLSQQATLQVSGCGARLPERPLAAAADCSEGRALGGAR